MQLVPMEEANRTGDAALHKKPKTFNFAIEAGWDKEYGGLLYFIDCKGRTPEAYDIDMKLWWPHNEILIASLMWLTGIQRTKSIWNGFSKRRSTANLFCGRRLRRMVRLSAPGRQAHRSRRAKAARSKGPFHVPRSLVMADVLLGDILEG